MATTDSVYVLRLLEIRVYLKRKKVKAIDNIAANSVTYLCLPLKMIASLVSFHLSDSNLQQTSEHL